MRKIFGLWLASLCVQNIYALNATWQSIEGSPLPTNLEQGVGFDLPFSQLKGWRYSWDMNLGQDWTLEDKIQIEFQVPSPCPLAQSILYLKSGEGWFRFPAFDLCKEPKVHLEKSQASTEGEVSGWGVIDAARLSFLPSSPMDTKLSLKSFDVSHQWGYGDLSYWGGFASSDSLEADLHELLREQNKTQDYLYELGQMAKIRSELKSNKELNSQRNKDKVMAYRSMVKKIYAQLEAPDLRSHKAIWLEVGVNMPSASNARELFEWLQVHRVSKIMLKVNAKQWASPYFQVQSFVHQAKENGFEISLWYDAAAPGCDLLRYQAIQSELATMIENFAWDGIHLDHWRFAEGSEDRFEYCKGVPMHLPWTVDSAKLEPGRQLSLLRAWLRGRLPDAKISLAVYSYPQVAKQAVAQDWSLWASKHWMDEVYTWTLSGDLLELQALAQMQKKALPVAFPHYVGLALRQGTETVDYWNLIRQIQALQKDSIYGYSFYGLNSESLPKLLRYLP